MNEEILQELRRLNRQLKELDEIKKLAEAKKIAITGWSEEKHQELYTRIAKG